MIKVKKTINADTRTAETDVTKEMLIKDTKSHIEDVSNGCNFFADMLINAGKNHDHTKIDYIDEFYDNFKTRQQGDNFKKLGWWEKHLTERHHLNDRVPDDVNLIDVMEMIIDCVMAGKARSGEVYEIIIKPDIIIRAINNTQKLLENNIEVVEQKPFDWE